MEHNLDSSGQCALRGGLSCSRVVELSSLRRPGHGHAHLSSIQCKTHSFLVNVRYRSSGCRGGHQWQCPFPIYGSFRGEAGRTVVRVALSVPLLGSRDQANAGGRTCNQLLPCAMVVSHDVAPAKNKSVLVIGFVIVMFIGLLNQRIQRVL